MTEKKRNSQRIKLGRWGEGLACEYLIAHGYLLIQKNYRTPDGEIDLVMQEGEELVFVEVKTRKNCEYSLPEEAINEEKLDHLESAAGWYLQEHPEFERNWHLDVITVIGTPNGRQPQIDWFENVTGT